MLFRHRHVLRPMCISRKATSTGLRRRRHVDHREAVRNPGREPPRDVGVAVGGGDAPRLIPAGAAKAPTSTGADGIDTSITCSPRPLADEGMAARHRDRQRSGRRPDPADLDRRGRRRDVDHIQAGDHVEDVRVTARNLDIPGEAVGVEEADLDRRRGPRDVDHAHALDPVRHVGVAARHGDPRGGARGVDDRHLDRLGGVRDVDDKQSGDLVRDVGVAARDRDIAGRSPACRRSRPRSAPPGQRRRAPGSP